MSDATPAPIAPDALQGGLKAALRLHEIGNTSPYALSFAGKGNSGASFGFMQGDLAAHQPGVVEAFQTALSAAGVPDRQIASLRQRLSAHLTRNPLTAEETDLVNRALDAPAGRAAVDAMDQAIFDRARGTCKAASTRPRHPGGRFHRRRRSTWRCGST